MAESAQMQSRTANHTNMQAAYSLIDKASERGETHVVLYTEKYRRDVFNYVAKTLRGNNYYVVASPFAHSMTVYWDDHEPTVIEKIKNSFQHLRLFTD